MICEYQEQCGGCALRHLGELEYQQQKETYVKNILSKINQKDISFASTVFIPDGVRRRTSLNFSFKKGYLELGYNKNKSHEIIDCYKCHLLTKRINNNLLNIRELIEAIAIEPFVQKDKKNFISEYLQEGDVHICEADNGLDVVLEFDHELGLEHRMQIFDISTHFVEILRISHRRKADAPAEVIIEKAKPIVDIKGTDVYIPAGTFLQASKEAETTLIDTVLKYVGTSCGKCLDLFCGLGTFSYPLSLNIKNKITAADSSKELLSAFENSVKSMMIPNITIVCKNLFKYPFSGDELKDFEIVIFDPPRAGASAQVKEIAKLDKEDKPQKVIAVSCNPETFVNDANTLIEGGYKIKEITIVDQFIYSQHAEVVALFEKL